MGKIKDMMPKGGKKIFILGEKELNMKLWWDTKMEIQSFM